MKIEDRRDQKEKELIGLLIRKTRDGNIKWKETGVNPRIFRAEHRGYSFKIEQRPLMTFVVDAPVFWHGDIETSKEVCIIFHNAENCLLTLWEAIPQISAENAKAACEKEESYQKLAKAVEDCS